MSKPIIRLFIGGGQYEIYYDCEISHELAPELTFTGHKGVSPFRWSPANREKLVRITTTAPYAIEFEEEKQTECESLSDAKNPE